MNPSDASGDTSTDDPRSGLPDTVFGPDYARRLADAGLDPEHIGIFNLGLRPRTARCLQRVGLHTLADIAACSTADILEIRGFGQTSLVDLRTRAKLLLKHAAQLRGLAGPRAPAQDASQPDVPVLGTEYESLLEKKGIDPHKVSINDLGLSVRTRNPLIRAHLYTLAQVIERTDEELLGIRNVGQKSLGELREQARLLLEKGRRPSATSDVEDGPRAEQGEEAEEPALGTDYMARVHEANLDLASVRLGDLGLSARTLGPLEHAGFETLAHAAAVTAKRLCRFSHLDEAELAELRACAWAHLAAFSADSIPNGAPATLDIDQYVKLMNAVVQLPEAQGAVLKLRYGLETGLRYTVREAGKERVISGARIQQIERNALEALSRQPGCVRACECIARARRRLGLGWADARIGRAVSRLPTQVHAGFQDLVFDLVGPKQRWVRIESGGKDKDGIVGFDSAVVAVIARYGPLLLPELAERVVSLLDPAELARFPQFSPSMRLETVGPAVMRSDGLYDLPDDEVPGIPDKRLRRLNGMIAAIDRLGIAHFSKVAAEVNQRLPEPYQMSEHDTHTWLGRYKGVFEWAGRGRFRLLVSGPVLGTPGGSDGEEPDSRREQREEPQRANRREGERRRKGIGDAMEDFLRQEGHQPMHRVREHILTRFQVNVSSIDAAVAFDRDQRFVLLAGDVLALRSAAGLASVAKPRARGRRRPMTDDLRASMAGARTRKEEMEEAAKTGFTRDNEHGLFNHLVIAALLGEQEHLRLMERSPAWKRIPERARQAALSLLDEGRV